MNRTRRRAASQPLKASADLVLFAAAFESVRCRKLGLRSKGVGILVAKYHDGREAELFSVPLEPPSPLTRPARPRSIGRLPGFTEPATGADLSARSNAAGGLFVERDAHLPAR